MLPAHANELAQEAPRRRFRKLRIAWSVGWGIACVLLTLLWAHTLRNQVRLEGWVSNSHFIRFTTFLHWWEIDTASYEIDPPRSWYPAQLFRTTMLLSLNR